MCVSGGHHTPPPIAKSFKRKKKKINIEMNQGVAKMYVRTQV